MQMVLSNCKQCIQHEGNCAKAPSWSIIVTAPLELLHVDFTSIEMMVEWDQPPNVVNILVFCEHFTKHVMVYVTPDQTVKTLAKSLWQGYISIFRVLTRCLSGWGANFESKIISELCELMGIRKVGISPYHAQTNGQVEWAHQMLMCMMGKLVRNQKVDWDDTYLQLNKISHHWIQLTLFNAQAQIMLTHHLLFPHDKEHIETPLGWSLCCWAMWMTVWSL